MMKKLSILLFLLISIKLQAQHALVQQLAQQINADSLLTYVKQLTGILPITTANGNEYITSRLTGSAGNTLAATFIKQKLSSWGMVYDERNFNITGQNIIAKLPGRRPDKVVMIGAHYDAVGTNNPQFFYPGADDNASGVAAVLEAARVCAGSEFPVTLHFAFWDEEEQNLVGSKATAPEYINKLVAYINHDMIAYDSNNDSSFDIHTQPTAHSELLAQKIYDAVGLYQAPLKPRLINPGETATDHGAFWQNNLTAVAVNEEYASQDDFNPNWHQLSDSITYFNIPYFVNMSKFGTTAFLHIAMDTTPLVGMVKQTIANEQFYVYPNPAEQQLYIGAGSNISQVSLLQITDVLNRLVYQTNYHPNTPISIGSLQSGVYFINAVNKQGELIRQRFIKN